MHGRFQAIGLRKTVYLVGFSMICMVLSGCASMTPEECKVADWRAIGEKDGSQGKPEQLAEHLKSCQAVGIVPNNALYRSGYQQGLKFYCQPQRILNLALSGTGHVDACPVAQQQSLTYYYRLGHDVYQARYDLQQQSSEQDRIQQELLDSKKLNDLQRAERRKRLRQLDYDLENSRQRVRDAEYRLSKSKYR